MRRIAWMLVAVGLASASNGIRPRGSPANYPAHVTSDGVTIAAAVVSRAQVRKLFATDLNGGGYIVIEVAIYPVAGSEVDLSSGDFMLSSGSESSTTYPMSARSIAGTLERKNSPARQRDTDVDVTVVHHWAGLKPPRWRERGRPGRRDRSGVGWRDRRRREVQRRVAQVELVPGPVHELAERRSGAAKRNQQRRQPHDRRNKRTPSHLYPLRRLAAATCPPLDDP